MEIRRKQAGALNGAIKVLAENLASRFVDPPGVDCSDYPKWGPRHTRTDRLEMRTRKWIVWALEKAKADPEIKI
jgi:stage V sporulation protein SpoVS